MMIGSFWLVMATLLGSTLFPNMALAALLQTAWIGYSLPPYSEQFPQILGQLAIERHENGTLKSVLKSWTPPSPSATDIRIGVLSGEPSKSTFTGSTIQVANELLLHKSVIIKAHIDPRQHDLWAIGVFLSETAYPGAASTSVPRLVTLTETKSPAPFFNKPVVLSKEGKIQEAPPERTLFQKYWWVLLAVTFVILSGGGGDGK